MEPPWINDVDDEQDEDWFFDSIKRYDQLAMYKLSCIPQALALSPEGSKIGMIGVLRKNDNRTENPMKSQVEILVFQLPDKFLTECPVLEGMLNKRDFVFQHGLRFEGSGSLIRKIVFWGNFHIISLIGNEIALFELSKKSDLMEKKSFHVFHEEILGFHLRGEKIFAFGLEVETELAIKDSQVLVVGKKSIPCAVDKIESSLESVKFDNQSILSNPSNASVPHCCLITDKMILVNCDKSGSVILSNLLDRNPDAVIVSSIANQNIIKECHVAKLEWIQDKQQLVVICDNKVLVFNIKLASNKNEIVLNFCHDGHKANVKDCCTHPKIQNLFFSCDSEGNLHSWKHLL